MRKVDTFMVGILVAFVVLASLGTVYAMNEDDNSLANTGKTAKNISYGECVSEQSSMKNSCHTQVKSSFVACRAGVDTGLFMKKQMDKCTQPYIADKKECKLAFHRNIKECAKIKHNIFETIASSAK